VLLTDLGHDPVAVMSGQVTPTAGDPGG
jgi:hypothetical protein